MPSILIIGNNDMGLYKFRRELVQELLDGKYEVTITTPYGSYIPELEQMGCAYYPIEYNRQSKNPIKELVLILNYNKAIKKGNFDVVLLYTIKPVLYAGFVCRCRKVHYLANITGLSPILSNSKLLGQLCFFMYKKVLHSAHMVFFQNKSHLELFQKKKVIGENIKLIPGSGVNLQTHPYENYTENERLRILYVGRITKVKGISELLEAIKVLRKEHNCPIFEFVGSCDDMYRKQIQEFNDMGNIIYYGEQTNPHDFMKNAQAVILPSYGEGMSNVLLEASACGRPVLASDVAGCREIIVEGETGFTFEPHDMSAIVEVIHKFQSLSREQREIMGRNGRKYVENHFSREIVVQEYMKEIRKCVEVCDEFV